MYTSDIHYVVWGTVIPKDIDEDNKRAVYECDWEESEEKRVKTFFVPCHEPIFSYNVVCDIPPWRHPPYHPPLSPPSGVPRSTISTLQFLGRPRPFLVFPAPHPRISKIPSVVYPSFVPVWPCTHVVKIRTPSATLRGKVMYLVCIDRNRNIQPVRRGQRL